MQSVPIVARMREALAPRRFAELRAEIVALRSRYAEVDADRTLHPLDTYVIVRVDRP